MSLFQLVESNATDAGELGLWDLYFEMNPTNMYKIVEAQML